MPCAASARHTVTIAAPVLHATATSGPQFYLQVLRTRHAVRIKNNIMLAIPEFNINAKQRELAGHRGRVFDVDLSQGDGAALCVTGSEDGTAKIWRMSDGRLEGEVAQDEGEVLRVAWAPRVVEQACGASLLAVAGADGMCNLWRGDDWATPTSIQRLAHDGDQVYGCAWSTCGDAYGAWLLTAAGATATVWDVTTGKAVRRWSYQEPKGDPAYVFDVQPAPPDAADASHATIACAVSDGTARVRDVRLAYDAQILRAPGDSKVTAVGWLGGDAVASCYGDGSCRVWDARTWRLLGRLQGAHASPCYGAARTDAFAARTDAFVASWASESLAFWDSADAFKQADATHRAFAPIRDPAGNAVPLFQCAFDAKHIVVCGGEGRGRGDDSVVPSVFVYDLEAPRKRGRSEEEEAAEKRPCFFV